MSRIALVIPTMGPGGAERVMEALASALAEHGHEVTLVTLIGTESDDFYKVDTVKRVALNLGMPSSSIPEAIVNNARIIVRLRRALKLASPGIVISFLTETNILSFLATRMLRVRLIVSEHTDPEKYRIRFVWDLLRRICYRRCDRIVAPTRYIQQRLQAMLKVKPTVIPNPVATQRRLNSYGKGNVIMAIGRMTPEKNHDSLLRAFARAVQECPSWKLVVVGDGPLRERIVSLGKERGLEGKVEFPGLLPDPWRDYSQSAEIFVMCSIYEGFPMALCEAMSAGLAVVCTRYNEGVDELIEHNVNGLVVPANDTEALSAAMIALMGSADLRARLGRAATGISARYGTAHVMGAWEELIAGVSSKAGSHDNA